MFSEKDLEQIQEKGISQAKLAEQLKNFENGFPMMELVKAATIGDGLYRFEKRDIDRYVEMYETEMNKYQVYKFVPASGAASRMFKSLFAFMEKFDGSQEALEEMNSDDSFGSISNFFKNIKKFAFYGTLKNTIKKSGGDLEDWLQKKEYVQILRYLLTSAGLEYGNLPKGLLEFHSYGNATRTPLEEHLTEGTNYCRDNDGKVDIHFTVSPQHKQLFKEKFRKDAQTFANNSQTLFKAYFSEQQSYTDTIAVDMDNQPFRNEDGNILFRPAGHGALLENLNTIDADIVFIKNIDNVVPDNLKAATYRYKKLLAGVLIKNQKRIFNYLKKLEKVENVSDNLVNEISNFLQNEMSNDFGKRFAQMHMREKANFLLKKLNRPIRVCGMVKNEGEPGGGRI